MPARANASGGPERQLMIKTKACQRLVKEVAFYKKELQDNQTKLQAMKDEERDPYDIKKFEEVVAESQMMIPDSEKRLLQALEDLSAHLETHHDDLSGEYLQQAKDLLQTHLNVNGKMDDGGVETTQVDDDVAVF